MTAESHFGGAGSPLPAGDVSKGGGAHGVTRPTHWPWSSVLACVVSAFLFAPFFCGCVTKAEANARVRAAYLAGQQSAFASMAGEGKSVTIVGPVEYSKVPWVDGLSLAQAIVTANYTGRHNPRSITIVREGQEISVSPSDLARVHAILLQPGDRVKLQE